MTRFVDKYLSSRIQGWPVNIQPAFSTQLTQVDSGAEQANSRWQDPLRTISIPQGFREYATVEALKRHWLVMRGPGKTWPWRDPTDFASVDLLEPNEDEADVLDRITRNDQPLVDADGNVADPDGVTTEFYLGKRYDLGSPAEPYIRRIYFPIVDTIEIAIDGVAQSPTITREGGRVTFAVAPAATSPGASMTWGGLFDIQVRFANDETFAGRFQTSAVGGFADIPLQEVPFCED